MAIFLCCCSLLLFLTACVDAQLTCTTTVGRYGECLCGVRYRVIEEECQDNNTYYLPQLSSQNLSCPFHCLNGGSRLSQGLGCNCPSTSHGLCCEVPTQFCGDVFVTPTGDIKSPGLIELGEYIPNSECVWRISTDPNRRIALGLVNNIFDIDDTGSNIFRCSIDHDYLEVHDGPHEGASRLGRFCGNVSGEFGFRTLYSSGRYLYLTFNSDSMNQGIGFHLRYYTFQAGTQCGRTDFRLPSGTIHSPLYPFDYPSDLVCMYYIHVKPGYKLDLITREFNVPSQDANCQGLDSIAVWVKKVGSESFRGLMSYCGNSQYSTVTIENASTIFLVLYSGRKSRGGRFRLEYLQRPASTSLPLSCD